jgi:plasmid stability protein
LFATANQIELTWNQNATIMVARADGGFVMASLTLKNVPEPLLKRLKKLAEKNRRSLNQEAIHKLEAAVKPRPDKDLMTPEEVEAQIEIWRKLAGKWPSKKSLEDEVAEIYGARTRGRRVDL